MGESILYLCGGRSFHSTEPGRKIGEVVRCWRAMGYTVHHVCGGDILANTIADSGTMASSYGAQSTYSKWYNQFSPLAPLVHTASEWRDIRHDRQMLSYLVKHLPFPPVRLVWERSSRFHNAGLLLARRLGVPCVLEWKDHLVDYRHSLFRNQALQLEARKIREADFIVVESDVLRDTLVREGADARKILVAHNAVDASEFSRNDEDRKRVRSRLGIADSVILVGYLGSYAFYHDAPRLVEAAALIADRQKRRNVRVLMVGAGKDYSKSKEMAEGLGVLDKTLLMVPAVPKNQVPSLLSALDIAVLPGSTDIICPIKVLEYMASFLPTVAPDYACNREVLTDGETGLLFEPESAESLAEKILALAEDDALRLRMAQQARQQAMDRFNWQATWGRALERILDATRPSRW